MLQLLEIRWPPSSAVGRAGLLASPVLRLSRPLCPPAWWAHAGVVGAGDSVASHSGLIGPPKSLLEAAAGVLASATEGKRCVALESELLSIARLEVSGLQGACCAEGELAESCASNVPLAGISSKFGMS